MNKTLIIGGSVLAAAVIIYFVWKSRKKSPTAEAAQQTGPQPGGAFAPKTLTEQDYSELEKIFKDGNPFNADLAKAIEGQGEDENQPLKQDGNKKILLTKEQFNNLVLAKIRRLIGERSAWIQDEEERRFQEWRGAVRAGYANSLAQAFAYAVRTDTAISNYYTGTPNVLNNSGSGSKSETGTDYKSILLAAGQNEATANLAWKPTNKENIIYADSSGRLFFNIISKSFISKVSAKSAGVLDQFLNPY